MKTIIIASIIGFGLICILIVKGGNRFEYKDTKEVWEDIEDPKEK